MDIWLILFFVFAGLFLFILILPLIAAIPIPWKSLWESNIVMSIPAILLAVGFGFVFSNYIILYIVMMVISTILSYGLLSMSELKFGQHLFFSVVIALALTAMIIGIVALFAPDPICSACGGRGYFGGGSLGQMVDCPDC